MRVLIILLLFVSACSRDENKVPVGFVKRAFSFSKRKYDYSPVGRVSLFVPEKYDTLLTWVDRSDNAASDKPKYRFTNSKGCLLKESGFFYMKGHYCEDSLDRLTIGTSLSGAGAGAVDIEERARQMNSYSQALRLAKPEWRTRKREIINGRNFVILHWKGPATPIREPFEQLTADTEIQQGHQYWTIRFRFECKQQACRDFAQNAFTTLHSVVIDTAAKP